MDLEEAKLRLPPMWTIYDSPRDFPRTFVVRVWYGEIPEPDATTHDTLEDARESVFARGGSFDLKRHPGDDPCIVETWI